MDLRQSVAIDFPNAGVGETFSKPQILARLVRHQEEIMKGKRIYVSVCVLGLLLALSLGAGPAQEPDDREPPQGDAN